MINSQPDSLFQPCNCKRMEVHGTKYTASFTGANVSG